MKRRYKIAAGLIGLFLGISASAADLSSLQVYPNPVRVYLGDAELVFDNIVRAEVVIYNSRAGIVKEFPTTSGPFIRWDLTDTLGEAVPSGVYFFRVKSDDQTQTGKFAIVR